LEIAHGTPTLKGTRTSVTLLLAPRGDNVHPVIPHTPNPLLQILANYGPDSKRVPLHRGLIVPQTEIQLMGGGSGWR